MSNLSELLPAGGAAKEFEVVASGTLPNGKPVVMKSDGTVEVVSGAPITENIPSGTKAVFDTSSCTHVTSAADPHSANKFIVAYLEDNLDGIVVVGTVSGGSITFGSEQEFNDGRVEYISVAFDPNTANKFVVCYRDINNANKGRARVGTISGTSVTYGTETYFNNATTEDTSISFDPNTTDKFVIAMKLQNSYGAAVVGTISGTSMTFGTVTTVYSNTTDKIVVSFDPNTANQFVIAFMNVSNHGKVITGTVSGTSLSFGTLATFNPAACDYYGISFDPYTAGRFAVSYQDNGNSSYGTVILGTLSGTDITLGSEYVFNSGTSAFTSISFDPNTANKFVVVFRDGSNSNYATALVGTISNNVISYGTKSVLNTGLTDYITVNFDHTTTGQFFVAFEDRGAANKGTAIVGQMGSQTTNLTSTNFAGTSTAAFTNGQTATIVPQGGVSTNQTSLTIGSTYYVQPAGTLATSAGTPSVVAGKAISATSLILKGNS